MDVDISGRSVEGLPRDEIRRFADRALSAIEGAGVELAEFEDVSLRFVSDAEMRELNSRFREKNHATDVLTFPGGSELDPQHLGDVVISVPTARRQATELGHDLATECRYLIVHGLLHALGYDHETDDGEMSSLELRIRDSVGLE